MTTLRLARNEVVALKRARGARIRVLAGCAWITERGSAADHVLEAGSEYRVAGDGLVVVEDFAIAAGQGRTDISVTGVRLRA
jgi:hypothetical protein